MSFVEYITGLGFMLGILSVAIVVSLIAIDRKKKRNK